MASTYGYATLADVENYTGIDYSTVDSVALADGKSEKKITIAERIINAYLGVTTGQTVTDGIKSCTIILAAHFLHQNLIVLGYDEGEGGHSDDLLGMKIPDILTMFLDETADSFVESIPMSGASYHKPDSRMFL